MCRVSRRGIAGRGCLSRRRGRQRHLKPCGGEEAEPFFVLLERIERSAAPICHPGDVVSKLEVVTWVDLRRLSQLLKQHPVDAAQHDDRCVEPAGIPPASCCDIGIAQRIRNPQEFVNRRRVRVKARDRVWHQLRHCGVVWFNCVVLCFWLCFVLMQVKFFPGLNWKVEVNSKSRGKFEKSRSIGKSR